MCGIVGYIGKKDSLPVLIDGLKRLEYRGYDSAGIAIRTDSDIFVTKAVGKIKELESKLDGNTIHGVVGIAHTRWATHGGPTEQNAHPHSDASGNIWLVHNGIIENYKELRKELEDNGITFSSETDSEVVAHLISQEYNGDLKDAVQKALRKVRGAYGIVAMHKDEPDRLIAVRYGSPLVLGVGQDDTIIASDVAAILRYTKHVIYLDDGELVDVTPDGYTIYDTDLEQVGKDIHKIEWDVAAAEKGGFDHFMLKEIFEQPDTILDTIRGRCVSEEGRPMLGGLEQVKDRLREIERIVIVACGTASYAGMIGAYMIEEYAGIPARVEFSSEFRYKKPILDEKTAVIAVSQSGETADTLAAIREAKEKGALTLGIINTVGSTIARETDAGVYNHIGPEIAVASTKAFTSQIAVLAMITVLLGRQREMSLVMGERILSELQSIPEKMKKILAQSDAIKSLAEKYKDAPNFAFLGRKYNYPLAFEGALKLKEISYIHAEGFAAGEMKHGHIALIDPTFPSFFIAPHDSVYEKNISNIEEIKSRDGAVIAIGTEGDDNLASVASDVMYIPKTLEMLTPLLAALPLQLFAYHVSVLKGNDVDQPRNLAKSVTVE